MRRTTTGILLFGLAALLVWGCRDDITRVQLGDGGTTYDLAVQVRTWPEGEPLPGAAWIVYGSGRSGVADSLGRFTCPDLEPGWHLMRLTAPGRLPVLVSLDMEDGLGDKNLEAFREAYLPAGTAAIRLRTVSSHDGRPLPNVPAWVDLEGVALPGHPYHVLDPAGPPAVLHTDSLGTVVLSGLPPVPVTLHVGAADTDGNGETDHQPRQEDYDLSAGGVLDAVLPLQPGADRPPQVVASSIQQGRVMRGAPAWILFDSPMDTSAEHTVVTVKRRSAATFIPLAISWRDERTLEIVPQEALVDLNRSYELSLAAGDRFGGSLAYSVSPFSWLYGGPGQPLPCETPVADLRLADPSQPIDDDTTEFDVAWTESPCASGYLVFARPQPGPEQWIQVGTSPTGYGAGDVLFHCVLPEEAFDRFRADDVVTPFAGRTVQLSVVPANASPHAPGPTHPVLAIADNTPARIVSVLQEGSAAAGEDSFLVRVVFSEYMDPAGGVPALQVVEAGGDPGYAVDPGTAVWRWDLDTRHGRFVVPLPPGADVTGDSLYVRPGDAADLSGNPLTGGAGLLIAGTGAVFDFEDSPQGWVLTGGVWEWGEPTTGPAGGHASARCWGTNLGGNYPANADASLTSPVMIVPRDGPVLTFWLWRELQYSNDRLTLQIEDLLSGETRTLHAYTTSTTEWERQDFALDDFAGGTIRLRFVFTSDTNWQAAGCFIDDVTLQ